MDIVIGAQMQSVSKPVLLIGFSTLYIGLQLFLIPVKITEDM